MNATYNADLSALNTFRLHSTAGALATFANAAELRQLLADTSLPHPFKTIGQGSNLLLMPQFEGTILMSSDKSVTFADIDDDKVVVRAGAAVVMDELCHQCANMGLWGLENLSGIPGTAGAAPVQNVGAYGLEACDVINDVTCYDTATDTAITLRAEQMAFGYRDSMFKHAAGRYIILEASFTLQRTSAPRLGYANLHTLLDEYTPEQLTPMIVRERIIAMRDSKLPAVSEVGSAGSFFKNPVVDNSIYDRIAAMHPEKKVPFYSVSPATVKIPAAWLIDNAGCKGLTIGGAAVWHNQPLVIVNLTGNATADDILAVETTVIERVKAKYSIELSPEVEHLGNK